MDSDLFSVRLRSAWRELVALNALRAERGVAIESDRTGGVAGADRALRDATADAERVFAETQAAIESRYRGATRKISAKADEAVQRGQTAYDLELRTIQEKADHSSTEARKKLEEGIWVAETVYEASEPQPTLQWEQECAALDERQSGLKNLEDQARLLVRRIRQRWPRTPGAADGASPADVAGDPDGALDRSLKEAEAALASMRRMFLAPLLVGVRLPLLGLLAGAAWVGWSAATWSWEAWTPRDKLLPVAVLAGVLLLGIPIWFLARTRIRPLVARFRRAADSARTAHAAAIARAARRRDDRDAQLIDQRDSDMRGAREKYQPILDEIAERRESHLKRIHHKYPRLLERLQERKLQRLALVEEKRTTRLAESRQRRDEALRVSGESRERAVRELLAEHARSRTDLEARWAEGMARVTDVITSANQTISRLFPPRSDPAWSTWTPPTEYAPAVAFGTLAVDVERLPGGRSSDPRMPFPLPPRFTLPAILAFPDACSLLLESGDEGSERAVRTLQTVMFRLLTAMPPGKVRFTIIDPVGLGQNFAGFMHLADHLEALVTDRIWTETRHIEQRLTDLTDHMENVIQKYLRNEYNTIAEYNRRAGEIAEPYRFLVVANFPVSFSEAAARRLASIIDSGARCGVHTLIVRDTRQPIPKGLELSDLRKGSLLLGFQDGRFVAQDPDYQDLPLTLDEPPDVEFMISRLREVGEAARDSSRVEVPFDVVAPREDRLWSLSSAADVRAPLGRMGATSLQFLELGRGTSQHALVAGKTGSGKSTLFHVFITSLALWYSPDEVELYLVDFKKGVEFKCYATHRLPHARAVAIESDREFGLSVLHRLDQELRRRGDLFRNAGVQDLPGYRSATGQIMPRTILLIDEFQEFFIEDDRLAQDAALLLDRLVRQGRAFGIHVILGSQTLGGAYSLAKSTMGQMAVRIALQCSESDSYLILSEDNSAARLLSRPGEAIYNDASGRVEGNSPFQIVWLPDEQREVHLQRARTAADARGYRPPAPPIVFEGSAAADVRQNATLQELLRSPSWNGLGPVQHVWMGEAVAIKDPTAALFRRQAGSNLLVVGQREDAAVSITAVSLVSLAAQLPPPQERDLPTFVLLDGLTADSPFAGLCQRVCDDLPHPSHVVGRREVAQIMQRLAEEVQRRVANDRPDHAPIFLFVLGLQRVRDLRQTDGFGFSFSSSSEGTPPAADQLFKQVFSDGPAVGVHTIIWCDTASGLDRALDRAALREFDMRVVFQMSAADSTNLIDSPLANKLGPRHGLFYNEEEGVLEKFRPYGVPDDAWLTEARNALTMRPAAP